MQSMHRSLPQRAWLTNAGVCWWSSHTACQGDADVRGTHLTVMCYRTVRNLDRYFGRTHVSDVPGAGTMGVGGRGDIHPAGPETAATAPVGAGNV